MDGSSRWQQVYDARDFRSIPAEGAFVTKINFRGFVPYGDTLSNVQIHLSTTMRAPDSLSPVFASNIGLDETRVFSGPLTIEQDTSLPYRFGIHLMSPFYYNPTLGNLLLDIRNYRGTRLPPFPPSYELVTDTSFGDTVSAVISYDVNSPQGDAITAGLLTIFTTMPIPEPGTVALLCIGLGFLIFFRFAIRKG